MYNDQDWNPQYLACEEHLRNFDMLLGSAPLSQGPFSAQQSPFDSDEREDYGLEASSAATFTETPTVSLQELFPDASRAAYLPPVELHTSPPGEGAASWESTGHGGGSVGVGAGTMHASTSANPPLVGVVGERAGIVSGQVGDVTHHLVARNDHPQLTFGEPQFDDYNIQHAEHDVGSPYDPNVAPAVPQDFQANAYAGAVSVGLSSGSNVDGIANEPPKPRDEVSTQNRQKANKGRRSDKESLGISCNWPGCSSTFTRNHNLKEHMKLHDNEMKFPCTVPGCGWRFNTRHLQRSHHKRKHHMAKEEA